MSYLIQQILLCLIIAAVLGFIIGWLLRGISAKQREHDLTAECDKRIRGLKIRPASELVQQTTTAVPSESSNVAQTISAVNENTYVENNVSAHNKTTGNKLREVALNQYAIEDIEGIGQGRGNVLREIGIATIQQLFDNYRQADGSRGDLASKLKIEEDIVRQWVSMADLMRIQGVGSQYSELLEATGVHSVPQLADQDALSLAEKMHQTNKSQHITVLALPGTSEVSTWITIAKSLPSMITV
jgi:predicted flap endonuclease-1-like 5' DNA nuclease